MKLKKLKIEGLYGYRNIEISFNENILFLVGINGSLKTTILKIIKFILSKDDAINSYDYKRIELQFENDKDSYIIYQTPKKREVKKNLEIISETQELSNKIHFLELLGDGKKEIIDIIKDSKEIKTDTELLKFISDNLLPIEKAKKIWENHIKSIKSTNEIRTKEKVKKQLKKILENLKNTSHFFEINLIKEMLDSLELKNLISYDILESLEKKLEKEVQKKVSEIEELKKDISDESNKNLIEMSKLLSNVTQVMKLTNTLKMVTDIIIMSGKSLFEVQDNKLEKFIKSINLFYSSTYKEVQINTLENTLRINIYKDKEKNNRMELRNFTDLSDGEKSIFILLTNLIMLDNKEIFLIDEPENSLHLKWQNALSEFLKNMDNQQFIIVTHSPDITSAFQEKNFKTLYPYEEKK